PQSRLAEVGTLSPELRTSDYSSARLGRDTRTSRGSKWFLVSLFDTSSQTFWSVARVRLLTSWSQAPGSGSGADAGRRRLHALVRRGCSQGVRLEENFCRNS